MIHDKGGNRLYRLLVDQRPLILKIVSDEVESRAYTMLSRLGVPTLPVHAQVDDAILLDDLEHSHTWRLATDQDVGRRDVGVAVARWYRAFHDAGSAYLDTRRPNWLKREWDALNAASIMETGHRLDLQHLPVWTLAASMVSELKDAAGALPQVFNYNDFHWSNLALSRTEIPIEAVVFDLGLLGTGLRYSDVRNVVGSLTGEAVRAFRDFYGPVNEREVLIDSPMSDLHGLWEASLQARFPSWALALVGRAKSGELQATLRRAASAASAT